MPSLTSVLLVAAGSAVGGVLRMLLVSFADTRITDSFPLGVLLVNVIGCFVFGVAVRYGVQSGGMSDTARVMLTTGLCGGFTTFSAFSMDIVTGLERGRMTMITSYVMLSLVLCVGAMLLGMSLGRSIAK
jgi:fluoride exporter